MKFYENKNNRHKWSKKNFQGQPYIPSVKKQGHPFFSPGDVVGFKHFFKNDEGVILYHRHNVKSGKVEYVVKLRDRWNNVGNEHVFEKNDLYLMPLTRKVLFEKYPYAYNKTEGIKLILSGTSIYNSAVFTTIYTTFKR